MADFQLGLYPISNPGVGIYNGVSPLVDGAGNTYIAFASQQPHPGENITTVEVYKYAPDGTQLEHHKVHPPGTFKINDVGLTHSGTNLIVAAVMHTPGANDEVGVASAAIPGYAVRQGMETEEGAAGAYSPSDGGGGGGDVDYDEVEKRLRRVLELPETVGGETLAHRISSAPGGNYRQGLEDKTKDAVLELITVKDGKGTQYQDALFEFVKNANAGVQANILGGKDAWGTARRDELKAAIREVLHETEGGL